MIEIVIVIWNQTFQVDAPALKRCQYFDIQSTVNFNYKFVYHIHVSLKKKFNTYQNNLEHASHLSGRKSEKKKKNLKFWFFKKSYSLVEEILAFHFKLFRCTFPWHMPDKLSCRLSKTNLHSHYYYDFYLAVKKNSWEDRERERTKIKVNKFT